jgi:hypothetical protein
MASDMKIKKQVVNQSSVNQSSKQLKKSAAASLASLVTNNDCLAKTSRKDDSSDESDSLDYNEVNSKDDEVKIDWTKSFHQKQRKTTAWDVIASGEYKVSNYFDITAPKKDKKILDSVLVFDGKDITMYKAWKESVSMAICANMSFSFEEKLFKLRSKVKGVPHGYVETYQLSGINFPQALRELDSMYQDNSDDQNALFEKLSRCKQIDLFVCLFSRVPAGHTLPAEFGPEPTEGSHKATRHADGVCF